jgi:hypothetical protein
MISPEGEPYDGLKNAWRYRKEYIKGCSCKPSEYSEAEIEEYLNNKKQKKKGARAPKTTGSLGGAAAGGKKAVAMKNAKDQAGKAGKAGKTGNGDKGAAPALAQARSADKTVKNADKKTGAGGRNKPRTINDLLR